MTKIKYSMKDGRYSIRAEGHAEYHPGNDIVCAAVSALLQMCWAGMVRECGAKGKQKQNSGEFLFVADVEKENRTAADALMKSVIYGLELIQEEFPEYVEVKEAAFL